MYKKIFFALLIFVTSIFASNSENLDFSKKQVFDHAALSNAKNKDSLTFKAAQDMLAVESLMVGFPLIGYRSEVGLPVTASGLTSLAALKFLIPVNEVVSTKKGLVVAALPVAICTVGLTVALGTADPSVPLASCTAIYAAFLATSAMKK